MLRTYGNRPAVVPPKPVEPEFVPKEHSKEELRQWQSTFNMIALLLKNHNRQSTLQTYTKLKKYNSIKKKYSQFLSNKLHLLYRRKCRQYLKVSFSALQSNRINFYTTKKQQSDKIKELMRSKAAALTVIIATKLEKIKVKNYFQELRIRTQLKSKMGTFKNTHIFSRLNSLYLSKLKQAWFKIDRFGKKKLQNLRKVSRVQKLITTKNKNLLLFSLTKLKINVMQIKSKDKKQQIVQVKPVVQAPPPVPKTNDRENQNQIRKLQNQMKTLNQKKKNLEKDLGKIEAESQKVLGEFRKQIKRLQSQNEELGFNNGLLEESNQQLQKQLQNRQKTTRKKLSKAQIWENVYNNLIHFLTVNKDKEITKSALLQCLEMPLVPCNVNLEELNDENKVLAELLEQYEKIFPDHKNKVEVQPQLLPFQVIRKQNRYYYMVLQVLSEWGISGSKQLEQLTNDLSVLQKKLAQ